ncbi:hypothetical protein [Tautonia rosea]|uniref:hypothetical protein n=1 Tax=Tautonia rosea TaxID=2728037 RepID=UPI00147319F2|nr:hypothetical protein [Tautonia rosea]
MNDVLRIITQASGSPLALRSGGPPTFPGPRISIEGTPRSFRMLADLLRAMADTVESEPGVRECGWRLVLGPGEAPALRMEPGCLLALDCEPEALETGDQDENRGS